MAEYSVISPMFNSHVAHSGETEQNLSSDFNLMFVAVLFVLVIETEKLELCIHKQNYMVEKLSGNPFTTSSYFSEGNSVSFPERCSV